MEEKNQKEISLLDLLSLFFAWLKRVFHNFFHYLGKLSQLIYRRKVLIIVVVLLIVIVGQYMARPSAREYKAQAIAMIQGSDAQTVREVFRQLENYDPRNYETSLSKKLGLPDSVAKNITDLSSYYLIDYQRDSVADKVDFTNSHSLTDTLNVRMRDRIYISMHTKSIAQVPQVEAAILNYLNNNPIIKSQFEAKREGLEQQINICDLERQRIDSLARLYYFNDKNNMQLAFKNNTLVMGEQRKQLFYGDLLRVQELKTEAEMKLSLFNNPVEIPASLVVSPVPLNGRVKYGVLSLMIGLIMGLVLAGFLESIQKIISFLKG